MLQDPHCVSWVPHSTHVPPHVTSVSMTRYFRYQMDIKILSPGLSSTRGWKKHTLASCEQCEVIRSFY